MRSLGEEIAVLDGLDDLGTLSGTRGYETRTNVIDPTEGANYTGGSDWSPGMPLVTSNAGLADSDLAAFALALPRPAGVQRPRFNVIDPTEGALYGGGSSHAAGMPLVMSNAGLADEYADGTYDGKLLTDNFDEMYGSSMDTLEGSFNKIRGYETRTNVIDPTEGANYTGGSDWAPGMPLVTSNAGLAAFDAVPDRLFRALGKRVVSAPRVDGLLRGAGQSPLQKARNNVNAAVSRLTRPGVSPAQKVMLKAQLNASLNELSKIRAARGAVIRKASPKIARNLARRRAA